MLRRTRVKLRPILVGALAFGLGRCASQPRGSAANAGGDVQLDIFEAAVRGMVSQRGTEWSSDD